MGRESTPHNHGANCEVLPPPPARADELAASLTADRSAAPSRGLLAKSLSRAMALSAVLIAGCASAHCDPNRWDPVNYEFCEDDLFPLAPPPSPLIEYRANSGYAITVLADGSRLTLDLASGNATMLGANGTFFSMNVRELDAASQGSFWALARKAATNPGGSFTLPIDQILARAPATPTGAVGKSFDDDDGDDELCKDRASGTEPVIECVESRPGYVFYWSPGSGVGGGWRVGPIDVIPGSFYVCPHNDVRVCEHIRDQQRLDWERERQQACEDSFNAGVALGGSWLAATASCGAMFVGLAATPTGVGTVPGAATVALTAVGCLASTVALTAAAVTVIDQSDACNATFPGPR